MPRGFGKMRGFLVPHPKSPVTHKHFACLVLTLLVVAGCSRTGLEVDRRSTLIPYGSAAPHDADAAPATDAGLTIASRRWIAVPVLDATAHTRLVALRLGRTGLEDVVQLNRNDEVFTNVWGDFSPRGRGLAVTAALDSGATRALRLWDFAPVHPTSVEPNLDTSSPIAWGPWLDDHRLVVYEPSTDSNETRAKRCALIDLDDAARPTPLDLRIAHAHCSGFYAVSPSRTLVTLAVFDDGSQALLSAPILPNGVGAFTWLLDVPSALTPARITFSPNGESFVLENADRSTGLLSLDVHVVSAGQDPLRVQTMHLTNVSYLNFVKWAFSSTRLFIHTTRIDSTGHGANPIFVADPQSGDIEEVTIADFTGSSLGFTGDGAGIITDAYTSASGSYAMQWISLPDLVQPPASNQHWPLEDSSGNPIFDGYLKNDGKAFFGFSRAPFNPNPGSPGPVDLTSYQFSPLTRVPPAVRLCSYAGLRRWLVSPDEGYLVYHVAVTANEFASADLLTQGHYASEAGTFLLPLGSDRAASLAMDWNSYQLLVWLPDSSGVLRVGPATVPSVEADTTIDDGQLTLVNPSLSNSIVWLPLHGTPGTPIDLTPYLSDGHQYSSASWPIFAHDWSE